MGLDILSSYYRRDKMIRRAASQLHMDIAEVMIVIKPEDVKTIRELGDILIEKLQKLFMEEIGDSRNRFAV